MFPRASAALNHIIVLDLTRVRSGPTCVRQLADWGANVIKVEMPEHLIEGEPMGGARDSSDFQNLHRNKRSLALDLKSPEGVAVLKRLAAKADVVVENFRPDVKTRLGIDYKALSAVNARLVYASISGFGQTGPYASRPGFDQIAQGMGGLMSVTGLPGQGPVRVGIPIADLTAGLFCALGIMVALLEREQSGKGPEVDTSLLQAQIFMLDFQAARWLVGGIVAPQAGNNHPTTAPTGVFKTKDGYINIAVAGQTMWERLCKTIDRADLAARAQYATSKLRLEHRDQLNAELETITAARTNAEWVELLNTASVPCGPIYKIDEMFADPQVEHLRAAQGVALQDGSEITLLAQPVWLSRTPSRLAAPPPELGEHTDEVLREFGFAESEIASLHAKRVV